MDSLLQAQFAEPLLERLIALAAAGGRPVLGLNGPVGAGKTSLCRWLGEQAGQRGLRLAVASIDDAYLPWEGRRKRLAGNPFGVSRVPPGSHDTWLLQESLARWQAGEPLLLPRFDKTLRDGQGDRCGRERIEADALVLEGWLIGCRPLGEEALARLECPLHPVLASLQADQRAWLPHWDRALDAYTPIWERLTELWLLRPLCWGSPRRWRFQAEARQRRSGAAWLDGAQLEALVSASLNSLPPELYQQPLESTAVRMAWLDGRRRCQRVSGAGPAEH